MRLYVLQPKLDMTWWGFASYLRERRHHFQSLQTLRHNSEQLQRFEKQAYNLRILRSCV